MRQQSGTVRLASQIKKRTSFASYFKSNYALYIMIIPSMLCLILFRIVPIFSNVIAFENYDAVKGIFQSKWIGFDNFTKFFRSPFFGRLIGNTFYLGIVTIIFTFPAPIFLALLLNEVKHAKFKKVTQTISYMPYFISTVVVIGLFKEIFSVNDGMVNDMLQVLGFERIYFFGDPSYFRFLYIITSLWAGIGYQSIIYLSAISSVNPELYESAVLDGANRWQQALHITLPGIASTIAILFIMGIGGIVSSDVSKILLMYSPLTYETADVIGTYVYREGILGGSYSYTTAIGLFTSVISLFFVFTTNYISRKISDISMF